MKEVWKDIKDYEGLYQVSNLGRIKSVDRIIKRKKNGDYFQKGRILNLQIAKNGYYICKLSYQNKKPSKNVHKLVAEAFISNPNNYPCINHKDENKLNNNVNNLEWCTCKYNNNYGTKKERISNALKGRKVSEETKEKHRKAMIGNTPGNKGKKRKYMEGGNYVYR